MTLAVAALHRTRGYQTEGFALLFALLPALFFASPTSRRGLLILDSLSAISLGIAGMLKEPFVVSAGLAMLVFCRTRA